jgi:cell division protein FtsQ
MSSIAYWQGSVGKRNAESAIGLERIFSVIILFLVLVLAGELLFHFIISPRLLIRDITIKAGVSFPLSDEEILSYGGVVNGGSYLEIDSQLVAERLESIPFVASALVEKKFPGSLVISLAEREAVATTIAEVDGRSIPLYISADGVLFPHPGLQSSDLPVISGLDIPRISGEMRLPMHLVTFLGELEAIRSSSPELYRLISELKFVKKNGNDYEVLIFPSHRQIRVRIGTSLDKQLLTYMMMILDVVAGQELASELEEIDFRTGEVVYRIREE